MSEYYAVQRSSDYLEHYGVRGMKWGVKKAIASGNARKIGRAYKKAQKHLNKLKDKANVEKQKAVAGVQSKKAIKFGLVTAGLGGIAGVGLDTVINGKKSMISYEGHFSKSGAKSHISRSRLNMKNKQDQRIVNHTIASTAVAGLGLGKTAYHTSKAIAAKYRTTQKGHSRAVAKADKFKSEMDKTFNTPYAQKLMKQYQTKKSKKRR